MAIFFLISMVLHIVSSAYITTPFLTDPYKTNNFDWTELMDIILGGNCQIAAIFDFDGIVIISNVPNI